MTIAYISQNEEIWNPNVQRPLQCSGIGKNTISDKLIEVIKLQQGCSIQNHCVLIYQQQIRNYVKKILPSIISENIKHIEKFNKDVQVFYTENSKCY